MGIHINGDHNSVNVVHGDVNNYGGDNGPPSSPPIGFLGIFFVGMILVVQSKLVVFWRGHDTFDGGGFAHGVRYGE
jgi:hypothetical protein